MSVSDCFHIAPFSTLESAHCALIVCDCEYLVLNKWLAFYCAFWKYIHWSGELLLSGRTFCVYLQPCTSLQCHFIPSHISRVDHFFRTCTPPPPFINHVNQSLAMDHRLLRPLFVDPLPPPMNYANESFTTDHHLSRPLFLEPPPPPPMNYANELLTMDHHLLRTLFQNTPPHPPAWTMQMNHSPWTTIF